MSRSPCPEMVGHMLWKGGCREGPGIFVACRRDKKEELGLGGRQT